MIYLWAKQLEEKIEGFQNFKLVIYLVVPGAPRLYFTNWFRVGLSIFTALVSLHY